MYKLLKHVDRETMHKMVNKQRNFICSNGEGKYAMHIMHVLFEQIDKIKIKPFYFVPFK
jgi:hypothetical protein